MRQLWTYPGSKWRLMPEYVRHLPPRYRHFVSPCVGTAAELAFKPVDRIETVNDKDRDIWNVFRVLQDARLCQRLLDLIERTPNGREQHRYCRALLDEPPSRHPSVQRAWALLVCGNIGRFGLHPAVTRSWSTDGKSSRRMLALPQWIAKWSERLRHVRLECDDLLPIIRRYDEHDTFFFLDPPYPFFVRSNQCGLYRNEMTTAQHEEMLRVLVGIKGFAFLCGYENPLYESYLWHWHRGTIETRTTLATKKGQTPSPRKEVIWLNYDPMSGLKVPRNKLFIIRRCVDYVGGIDAAQRYLDKLRRLTELPE